MTRAEFIRKHKARLAGALLCGTVQFRKSLKAAASGDVTELMGQATIQIPEVAEVLLGEYWDSLQPPKQEQKK